MSSGRRHEGGEKGVSLEESISNESQAQELDYLLSLCKRNCENNNSPFETPKKYQTHRINDFLSKLQENARHVICVDKNFKHHFTSHITTKKSHIYSYPNESSRIKITKLLSKENILFNSGLLITAENVNGKKINYFVSAKAPCYVDIFDQIERIQKITQPEYFEDAFKKQFKTTQPFSSNFWGKAKKGSNWDADIMHEEHYESISDPMLVKVFKKNIFSLANGKKELTIVDAGGGKGRLASKLLKAAQEAAPPYRVIYILIEPDKYQCKIAQKNLAELKKNYGSKFVSSFKVINSTMEDFAKSSDFTRKYKNRVDGIVSSGGPLNAQVVSFEAALHNLKIMQNLLKPGGQLVATGLSPVMLTKKIFQREGFTVHQTSAVPENYNPEIMRNKFLQCYVCEKQPPSNEHLFAKSKQMKKNIEAQNTVVTSKNFKRK